jgi:hypothetical protein
MMQMNFRKACLVAALCVAGPASADEQAAIDGCIDALRATGLPDAQSGGEVLSREWSQAGTVVMLRDGGGTVWRCIGYDDGTVGELTAAEGADDGGGAMAGAGGAAGGDLVTSTQRVQFEAGSSGAEYSTGMIPNSADRYVLGASNGQDLYVRVATTDPGVSYRIFNPDGSSLLDEMSPDREYRGQLWQFGDHVVEVINRGAGNAQVNVILGIE